MSPCCPLKHSLPLILFFCVHERAPLTDCKLPEGRSPFARILFWSIITKSLCILLQVFPFLPFLHCLHVCLLQQAMNFFLKGKCKHLGAFFLLFPVPGPWPNSCPFQNHSSCFWQILLDPHWFPPLG